MQKPKGWLVANKKKGGNSHALADASDGIYPLKSIYPPETAVILFKQYKGTKAKIRELFLSRQSSGRLACIRSSITPNECSKTISQALWTSGIPYWLLPLRSPAQIPALVKSFIIKIIKPSKAHTFHDAANLANNH
jgi:hypothetical protein